MQIRNGYRSKTIEGSEFLYHIASFLMMPAGVVKFARLSRTEIKNGCGFFESGNYG
jgi:hypothetical protein